MTIIRISKRALQLFAFSATAFFLSGCANFLHDNGFIAVNALIKDRTGQEAIWTKSASSSENIEASVTKILRKPISVEDAVAIALMNNKSLQANFAALGIAEADFVQAGRISNPTFSIARLTRGSEIEYERQLTLPLLSLLAMPITTRIESNRFKQEQLRAAGEAVRIADETRRAYFAVVAAQESVKYMEQANTAAEASAELAKRMQANGNWSKLQQAREQSFHADTLAKLRRSKQTFISERERLVRLLGLSESNSIQLPQRLPDLPDTPKKIADVESQAMENRLDLMLAKRELSTTADSLGLSRATRFINVFELGYRFNTSNEQAKQSGYEITFNIPLFDWGNAHIARAEAIYMQSANRTAAMAVNARSEVRQAYNNYHTAYDIAKQLRDDVVPLKKRIFDEQLLRYNGMLIDVFELLSEARAQVTSVNTSIEALRDFWIADSALQMALTGTAADISTPPQLVINAAPANH